MDLVSIKRKYRNIRNIILVIFLIVIVIGVIIVIKEVERDRISQKVYESTLKLCENAQEYERLVAEQKKKEEEERIKAQTPQFTEHARNNISNIYHSEGKRVFLTFDDGPSANVTPIVLDTLKNEGVTATFFVLGSRVELNPELIKREYEEHHFIASHGYSHVYSKIYSSPQAVLDEYNKSVSAIQNALGNNNYNPHLFRFPGGYTGGKYASIKKEAAQLLDENEVAHIDWNSLTSDAAGCTTTEQFLAEIDKTVGNKTSVVLLMHDAGGKKSTADALPQIIAYFRDRGFEFENFYSIMK